MSIELGATGRAWVRRIALLGACTALLAACGTVTPSTPATVKPVDNPLPGFTRAIQAARSAAQAASNDNGLGATNVTVPTVTTP